MNNSSNSFNDLIVYVTSDKNSIKLVYKGTKDISKIKVYCNSREIEEKNYHNRVTLHISNTFTTRIIYEFRFLDAANNMIEYIQFAKESPGFLKKEYGFNSKFGYLVIEDCSFDFCKRKATFQNEKYIINDTYNEINMLKDEYKIFTTANRVGDKSFHKNIENSIILTKFIWNKFSKTGPSNTIKNYMSSYKIMKLVEMKKGTLQCTGTRDLFIALSVILNLNLTIRKVEAFRYSPEIENIVVNGHSIVEIKVYDKWILFDPFVRVFFIDQQSNNLLSASDLSELLYNNELCNICPIHVETKHGMRTDFNSEFEPYNKHKWNYFTHFNYLLFKELTLTRASLYIRIKNYLRKVKYG